MNNYAIIQSGKVMNIVIWDGGDGWSPPDGSTAVQLPEGAPVDIGWSYDGTKFTASEQS